MSEVAKSWLFLGTLLWATAALVIGADDLRLRSKMSDRGSELRAAAMTLNQCALTLHGDEQAMREADNALRDCTQRLIDTQGRTIR